MDSDDDFGGPNSDDGENFEDEGFGGFDDEDQPAATQRYDLPDDVADEFNDEAGGKRAVAMPLVTNLFSRGQEEKVHLSHLPCPSTPSPPRARLPPPRLHPGSPGGRVAVGAHA